MKMKLKIQFLNLKNSKNLKNFSIKKNNYNKNKNKIYLKKEVPLMILIEKLLIHLIGG